MEHSELARDSLDPLRIGKYPKPSVKEVISISKSEHIHFRVSPEIKKKLLKKAGKRNLGDYLTQAGLQEPVVFESFPKEETSASIHINIKPSIKRKLQEHKKLTGMNAGIVIEAALTNQKLYVIDLKELSRQISKVGTNINQLTMLAHSGKIQVVNLAECKELMSKVLDELIIIAKILKERK